MTELTMQERQALIDKRSKDERVLIFRNLLNGVAMLDIMKSYQKSEKEIMDIFKFVGRKIADYCFKHKMPPVFCDGLAVAQRNKLVLSTLVTSVNLDKDPVFGKVSYDRVSGANIASMLSEQAIRG